MAVQRCQIPFTFEYLDASGRLIPAPIGTPVVVTDRNTLAVVTVYAGEHGDSTMASPSTDVAGNVQGWLPQGSYTLSAASNAGAVPPYLGQIISWDAVRGDGVEAIYPGTITVSHLHALVTPFLIPTGAILDHAGGSAPTGFLLCDGTQYPTATWPNLFAVHGYTFGGSGANFNVPDCRGRVHIGAGTGVGGGTSGVSKPAGGSALTARVVGAWGGTETYALSSGELGVHSHGISDPTHAHNVSDPGHAHAISNNTGGISANHYHGTDLPGRFTAPPEFAANDGTYPWGSGAAMYWTAHGTTSPELQDHTHTWGGALDLRATGVAVSGNATGVTTQNTGSGTAHTIQQPAVAITKIIKT